LRATVCSSHSVGVEVSGDAPEALARGPLGADALDDLVRHERRGAARGRLDRSLRRSAPLGRHSLELVDHLDRRDVRQQAGGVLSG
jgi:hypothetical protein